VLGMPDVFNFSGMSNGDWTVNGMEDELLDKEQTHESSVRN